LYFFTQSLRAAVSSSDHSASVNRPDLGERVVSFADEAEWLASPSAGVERRMLD
jgi:hypothetical protein